MKLLSKSAVIALLLKPSEGAEAPVGVRFVNQEAQNSYY